VSESTKLSDFVMRFLVEHGVRHVFMLPGGGAMHLDDSLGRCRELDYIVLLHEQALAIAAEAYGQHTDRPGVGLVTSGPGGTNAVTGVAAAYFDSTPCLFISGQAKRGDLKRDTGVRQMGSQEVDIVSVVSPVTKYAAMVTDPLDIRYHLERAWHEATSGRMGPVWLDIPLDVQAAVVDAATLKGFEPAPSITADAEGPARAVARLLASAERPLVLAGNGVKLAGAQADLLRVVEDSEVPLLLTWKTIDLVGHDHPLFFGCPGIMGCRTANFLVQNCDLLLVVGSRLDPSLTAFDIAAFGRNARRVVVDIDEAEVRKLGNIEMPVVLDAREFLRELAGHDEPHGERSAWLGYARGLRDRYPVVLDEYRECEDIDLYAFTEMLFDHLAPDDVIAPESSGAAGEITFQAMRVKVGQKVRNAAGLGAMGFGLPYAIGACVANDRRRTVLINGDGAFQLNLQELETLVRLRLPVKMFILDNGGYASIRAMQRNQFDGLYVGSSPDSGLTLPGLDRLASAYGLRFEEARSSRELEAAIARTLEGEEPVLCRVVVNPVQVTAPRVQAMRTPEGSMVSKPLEDMWPYLPPDELAAVMIGERSAARGGTGEAP
jgi:acetolactate synthase I/II/III large subunit